MITLLITGSTGVWGPNLHKSSWICLLKMRSMVKNHAINKWPQQIQVIKTNSNCHPLPKRQRNAATSVEGSGCLVSIINNAEVAKVLALEKEGQRRDVFWYHFLGKPELYKGIWGRIPLRNGNLRWNLAEVAIICPESLIAYRVGPRHQWYPVIRPKGSQHFPYETCTISVEFLGLPATSEQLEDPAALTKSKASTGLLFECAAYFLLR